MISIILLSNIVNAIAADDLVMPGTMYINSHFITHGRQWRRRVLSSVHASICPSVCTSVRPEKRYRFKSLSIAAIGLKSGGMMHSTMKKIAIQNGHAWPIVARVTELWNFPF